MYILTRPASVVSHLYSSWRELKLLCFQMRPDIKKDVFHLCWAPEKLPPDEVSVDLVIHSVCLILPNTVHIGPMKSFIIP